VREGHSYVVMSEGKPVAKIVSANPHGELETSSRATLLARLRSEPVIEIGRWTRDELYEDAP
jgi:antitoxin (DNA-binding transcriptional repressor) of toxin-antitoxin stability system